MPVMSYCWPLGLSKFSPAPWDALGSELSLPCAIKPGHFLLNEAGGGNTDLLLTTSNWATQCFEVCLNFFFNTKDIVGEQIFPLV